MVMHCWRGHKGNFLSILDSGNLQFSCQRPPLQFMYISPEFWSLLLKTSFILCYFYSWFCICRCTFRTWCCGLLYSFKWFSFLIMQVCYLKCSGRLGRIQSQHGRYHFPLYMLIYLFYGFLLYQVFIPEFFSDILVTTLIIVYWSLYFCITVMIIILMEMFQCYLLVMLKPLAITSSNGWL
jgi:hypothetical protein